MGANNGASNCVRAEHIECAATERIRIQQRTDKNKLRALRAPEVECIGKGKARKQFEFGVKVSLAVTHLRGLMVCARSLPGDRLMFTRCRCSWSKRPTSCKTWGARPGCFGSSRRRP
jgi:hypothetical protein